MRVLFLTIGRFGSIDDRGIYTDLLREFRDAGHDVCVVSPVQRRDGGRTQLLEQDGIRHLLVRTGNLTKTGLLEKVLSTLLVEYQFARAIDRFFGDKRFDVVLYSTPPVTLDRVVSHIKQRDGSLAYLLLKDIFPQNAVDLGMMRHGGLAWRYFRARETRLYASSDWIGCMSEANVSYVVAHNPQVAADRVEVCPNAITPVPRTAIAALREAARGRLGLQDDDVLFLYGGNFGRPQGIDFILECLARAAEVERGIFLLVGSGTEYNRIETFVDTRHPNNVRLLSAVQRDEYDQLLAAADVGLVFLDHRFTIPNFPSRLTSYMEASLPVLAATDRATDLGSILRRANAGIQVASDDPDAFIRAAQQMCDEVSERQRMGAAGREYLEQHYTARDACARILGHLETTEGTSRG